MVDINLFIKSIKIAWIKRLISTTQNCNCQEITKFYYNQYGKNLLILYMDFDQLKTLPNVKYKLSAFYSDILKVWIEFRKITNKKRRHKTFYNIRKQLLWGNNKNKNKSNKSLNFHRRHNFKQRQFYYFTKLLHKLKD